MIAEKKKRENVKDREKKARLKIKYEII